MKSEILARAVELERKLDLTLFAVYRGPDGRYYREDGTEATAGDFKSVAGAAKAVGAGAAIGGAILGGKALAGRYGADKVASPMKAGQAIARGVGRDVGGAVAAAKQAIAGKANVAADAFVKGVSRDKGRFAKKSIWRGIRGATAAVTGGRVKLPFEQIKGRIIELAEKAA